jgi:hypothetical protein
LLLNIQPLLLKKNMDLRTRMMTCFTEVCVESSIIKKKKQTSSKAPAAPRIRSPDAAAERRNRRVDWS